MRKVTLKRKRAANAEQEEKSVDETKNSEEQENSQNGDDVDPLDGAENNSTDKVSSSSNSKKKGSKGKKGASKTKTPEPAEENDKEEEKEAEKEDKELNEEEDEDEEYEVEAVVDHKTVRGKTQYLIRWKGYGEDSDTWEPENTLSCPDIIAKYKEKNESPAPKAKKGKKAVANDGDEENENAETEYEVDKIMDVQFKKNGDRNFLIRWKGFGPSSDTWEPEAHVNCPELVEKFMKKVDEAKSKETKTLRTDRQHTKRFTLVMENKGRRVSKRHNNQQRAVYYDAE